MRALHSWTVIAGIAILLSCSEDTTKPQNTAPSPYLRPTTPENVMTNFLAAHQRRDIAAYRETIADEFEFRAVPGVGYTTLNKAEDETVVGHMFDEAISIQIRLDHAGADSSDYADEFPANDGYMQIVVPAVRLEIATTRDEGQGPITYLIDGDRALFMLKETSAGVWQIVMQEDQS